MKLAAVGSEVVGFAAALKVGFAAELKIEFAVALKVAFVVVLAIVGFAVEVASAVEFAATVEDPAVYAEAEASTTAPPYIE